MPRVLAVLLLLLISVQPAWARLEQRDLAAMITPPMQLGVRDPSLPIWTLLVFLIWHGIFVEDRIVITPPEPVYPVRQ